MNTKPADDEHEGSFARGAMFAVLFSIPLYAALWLVAHLIASAVQVSVSTSKDCGAERAVCMAEMSSAERG